MYFPTANSLQNPKRMNTNLTGFKSLLGHTNIGPYHQIQLFFLVISFPIPFGLSLQREEKQDVQLQMYPTTNILIM